MPRCALQSVLDAQSMHTHSAKRFYMKCAEFIEYRRQPNPVSPHRDGGRSVQLKFGSDTMGEAQRKRQRRAQSA